MDQTERVARTVSQQRTGSELRWREFVELVEQAEKDARPEEGIFVRDLLDTMEDAGPEPMRSQSLRSHCEPLPRDHDGSGEVHRVDTR